MYGNLKREENLGCYMDLTKKQKEVLDYIENFVSEEQRSPSYSEIQKYFGFKSKGSVQDYVRYIKNKGFLKDTPTGAIELAQRPDPMVQIPLLGNVAAGSPLDIESNQDSAQICVPEAMVYKGECFALRVQGESMIDDCIMDGDVIVVRSTSSVKNGDTVVALVEGAATVKRYMKKDKSVELHPRNKTMSPIIVKGGDFQIQGIVVGLMRTY